MNIPKHYRLIKEHPDSFEMHDGRDGRSFHVAKQGLDDPMKKQMQKMPAFADGGEVPGLDTISSSRPQQAQDDFQSGAPAPEYGSFLENAKKYGGGLVPVDSRAANDLQEYTSLKTSNPESLSTSEGARLKQLEDIANPSRSISSDNVSSEASAPSGQEVSAPTPPPVTTSVVQQPMVQPSIDMSAGLVDEKKALVAGAAAEGKAATQTADAWDKYNQAHASLPTPNDLLAKHAQADADLQKAFLDKKIDPDHYWNSRSTGQKIAAGLGMIFGGMGSALSGQPNLAMHVINSAIERDMDAQKSDQSKSMNLWKMNRERTQDEMQANAATENQLLSGVKAKAMQYQAMAAGPEARARIAPVMAEIDQKMAMNNMFRSLSGPGQKGDEASFNQKMGIMQHVAPKYYEDLQKKYIPGVGVAKIPLGEKDREGITKMSDFKNKLNEAINFQNKMGSSGAWSPTNRAEAAAMKSDLITSLNDVKGLNRFTGEEAKLYEPIIGDLGSMNPSGSVATNLTRLKNDLSTKQANLATHLGITPFSEGTQGGRVRVVAPDGTAGTLPAGQPIPQGYRAQ